MRRYSGGYDQKHMDFFNDIGEFTILRLKNEGFGLVECGGSPPTLSLGVGFLLGSFRIWVSVYLSEPTT